MAQLQAVPAALGLALTELWLVNLQPLPAVVAGGWEQIGFWRKVCDSQAAPPGDLDLSWEKQQAKSSVASCVFTDSYCATGPKDARRLSFITSPHWSERHTGQLHPSCSLVRFWEGGRLLEQSRWETVGTRIML